MKVILLMQQKGGNGIYNAAECENVFVIFLTCAKIISQWFCFHTLCNTAARNERGSVNTLPHYVAHYTVDKTEICRELLKVFCFQQHQHFQKIHPYPFYYWSMFSLR